MKRFVKRFWFWNGGLGGELPIEEQITNYAETNGLTIITITASQDGIYALFEKGGEER
ncbi:MAG: hypothetical protein J6U68_04175 [Clostridia bacterium]|nr:hypothetical protein [Clostridia bacterium]